MKDVAVELRERPRPASGVSREGRLPRSQPQRCAVHVGGGSWAVYARKIAGGLTREQAERMAAESS
jgi:hypothetical protein